MDSLILIATNIPESFDENEMFKGVEADARLLREEFRLHFMNISRIMDCVGCDKCRLWGKLQTHGMGTALKILFSDLPRSINGNGKSHIPFYLTRYSLFLTLLVIKVAFYPKFHADFADYEYEKNKLKKFDFFKSNQSKQSFF